MEYVTTSTGREDIYLSPTGARRDSQAGKPRYELIHPLLLKRLAGLLTRGAEKYGENNWTKGQETDRTLASLLRHTYAYIEGAELGDGGDREDHLAAIVFNVMSLMVVEDGILSGRYPLELQTIEARLDHFKWEVSEDEEPEKASISNYLREVGDALIAACNPIFGSLVYQAQQEAEAEALAEMNRAAADSCCEDDCCCCGYDDL